MATITLSDVKYYRSSAEWHYSHIGNAWESGAACPSTARYTFTAPNVGASSVSFSLKKWYLQTGNYNALRFFIGTSATSHMNADSTYEYTGDLTVDTTNTIISGSANILLIPGKTYYLWVFPSEAKYGIYGCENAVATLETSGAAGLARIGNGSTYDGYMAYIGNGSSFDMYIPYVGNGSGWDLYS